LLPNGAHARVDDRKLLEHVLNPSHPVGGHHAAVFDRVLGINRSNAHLLRDALLEGAARLPVVRGKVSPFGTKYEQRLTLHGPRGRGVVLAVRMVEVSQDTPRPIIADVE
jgi:hypothetical protein